MPDDRENKVDLSGQAKKASAKNRELIARSLSELRPTRNFGGVGYTGQHFPAFPILTSISGSSPVFESVSTRNDTAPKMKRGFPRSTPT